MKRYSNALSLLLCLLVLSACGKGGEERMTTAPAHTTEAATETAAATTAATPAPEVPALALVKDGATDFRIVRRDGEEGGARRAAMKINSHFASGGVKATLATDWDTRNISADTYEILVGKTAYTPADAIDFPVDDLGTRGFAVLASGHKILLLSATDEGLTRAADHLIDHFINFKDGKTTMPQDYRYIESNGHYLSELTLGGTSITDFTLTAPAGYEGADAIVRELIADKCGVNLADTGAHRIVLEVSDDESRTVRAAMRDGDLVITAHSPAEMERAVYCFFMETVYHAKGTLALPADLTYARDMSATVFYGDYVKDPKEGVCCMDGLIAAHNEANRTGAKVFADYGARYYISSPGKTITVRTDVEWGNAAFTIDDAVIPLSGRGNWIFTVASDEKTYNITALKTLDRSMTNLGITLPQKSLVTVIDDTSRVYIRSGGNANQGSPKQDTVVVSPDGSIDMDAPLIWNYDKITSVTVRPLEETPLTVSGGSFTTIANKAPSEYTYYARGLLISRSHVTVRDVKHYVTGEGATGAPYSAFFQISNCAYVTVESCLLTGHKTYQSPTTKMGSYDINGTGAISLTFRDCTQTNDITDSKYWGVLGSNFCKNLTYDGCILSRFDAHQGVANATIRNSTIGHMGANAIGYGTLLIENSTFYSSNVVNLRNDYGSTWEGDLIIRNCTFVPTAAKNCYVITGKNDGTHNYGYTCYMPTTVTIEGLHVEATTQMYVFADMNPNCKSAAYTASYPHIPPQSVTVSGYTASGKNPPALKLSPNAFQFAGTQFTVK